MPWEEALRDRGLCRCVGWESDRDLGSFGGMRSEDNVGWKYKKAVVRDPDF